MPCIVENGIETKVPLKLTEEEKQAYVVRLRY